MNKKDKSICKNSCHALRIEVPDCNECDTNCGTFRTVTPDTCYSCSVYIESRSEAIVWEPLCYHRKNTVKA